MVKDFRPIGPGRFRILLGTPWGQALPAEMLLSTRAGWPRRAEAVDPRWAAFVVGPVVIGMRLLGELQGLGEQEVRVERQGEPEPEPGIEAGLFHDGSSRSLRQRVAT